MNRVILGEASIMCSRGFGEEKKKTKKKNPPFFIVHENEGSNNDYLG